MKTAQRKWNVVAMPQLTTTTGAVASLGVVGRLLAAAVATANRPSRPVELHRTATWPAASEAEPHLCAPGARCSADWRRPQGYWACSRPAGHTGHHRMRGVPGGLTAA